MKRELSQLNKKNIKGLKLFPDNGKVLDLYLLLRTFSKIELS